jgi:hypothetical protein
MRNINLNINLKNIFKKIYKKISIKKSNIRKKKKKHCYVVGA